MRIAYVCGDPGVPVFGTKGCSIHVQEVLRAMVQTGIDVDLLSARIDGECAPDLAGVRLHAVPFYGSHDPIRRERELLAANSTLRTMLHDLGPFDLVYERHALWMHAAMEYGRDEQIASVLEVNAPLIDEQSTHRQLFDRRSAELVTARALNAARTIVAVSKSVADYVRRFGVDNSRIDVVANGVRPERFPVWSFENRPGSHRFTIGFVGSLRPWHAVADLVDAFQRLHGDAGAIRPRLLIVGDGPQRTAIDAQIASLPEAVRAAVEFAGAVSYELIPRQLAAMDVAVAPYAKDQECYFSPLKLLEYMAAGLPTVAARSGQMSEIIRHGENGLLYSPGDIDALAEALRQMHDEVALRERLGSSARRDVVQHHTWSQRVAYILSKALAQPRNDYVTAAVT